MRADLLEAFDSLRAFAVASGDPAGVMRWWAARRAVEVATDEALSATRGILEAAIIEGCREAACWGEA